MNIAILGNGNIGSGLASAIEQTAHTVTAYGHEADLSAAVAGADVVILATPYGAAADIAEKADFGGKIVVDVTNPVTEDFSALQLGHTTSAAEQIARLFQGARVVKAFNTVFAQHYGGDLTLNGEKLQTFVASDDEPARKTVMALASDMGFDAVDAGPLGNARYLEPLGFLNIQFGYVLDKGVAIAPKWQGV